ILAVSWEEWWTYDGISGPSFWGLINPDWNLCNQGKRQSPIDIQPKNILFDPNLKDIDITQNKIDGTLENSGHGIVFTLETSINDMINISGGPLAYNYPIHSVAFHFGLNDDGGSEHLIDGRRFPGEIQILGYNADLYENLSLAVQHPNGLVGISILMEIGDLSNPEIRRMTNRLPNIQFGGQTSHLTDVFMAGFLPASGFMTYEGSMTEPGCQETITWILMNRPIYITDNQIFSLRKLMQGEKSDPRAPLGGNFRPIQALNGRTIRTNIMLGHKDQDKNCPTLHKNLEFK
ncbi:hypothetical protein TCAL_07770, partial [Tigriopus californicus]